MAHRPIARTRGNVATGNGRIASHGIETLRIQWPRTLLAKRQRPLAREHLRFKAQRARGGILHCFLLDCSGSMAGAQQLALAQGALLHLHQRAYQQRADIALISYAGDDAVLRIPPAAARPFNARQLQASWLPQLSAGGGTPLARAIATADALLAQIAKRNPRQQRWLWLLSDGRSDELPQRPAHADVVQIVDCERQRIALQRCRVLAERWQADYRTLDELIGGDSSISMF